MKNCKAVVMLSKNAFDLLKKLHYIYNNYIIYMWRMLKMYYTQYYNIWATFKIYTGCLI